MRRCLATALLATAALAAQASGQVLDETMVPRGRLRLQAHPTFTTWDTRFGRAPDGSEGREDLGEDLTHADALALYPGVEAMETYLESASGLAPYEPTLGSTGGRVTQDITRIDFGGHLGVLDWLTVGVVVPWMRTRSAIDLAFAPDTVGGADLGLSPRLAGGGVDTYLGQLGSAVTAADARAAGICAGGPSAECTSAQALAARASGLHASLAGAYAASPFFPLAASTMGTALVAASATLDVELAAAGLAPVGAAMPFAADPVTEEQLRLLSTTAGVGIGGSELTTRRSLWQTGDVEVSALVRLLEGRPAGGVAGAQPAYRLVLGLLARLPTGAAPDPDVFYDVGTGDGQTDLEARLNGVLRLGRLSVAAGARYGVQRPTELERRVAAPEVAMPPVATRRLVRWEPASYVGVDVAPTLRLTEELWLVGEYRYFYKGRDVYALVEPDAALDARVLALETGMKAHRVGGGLRFTSVDRWAAGVAPRPFELHVRLVHTIAGSGGQTPVATRVEAGIRLFRRLWGPAPAGGS